LAAFFDGDFFVAVDPALFAAQRFFNAATIAARPAALSFRFGFAGADADDVVSPLAAAQRCR